MTKMVIGISAGRKYENYHRWISDLPDVEIIKLSYDRVDQNELDRCMGVVLTGGEDVHPWYYKKPELLDQYKLTDINESRDAFELQIIRRTQEYKVPLLGICRGLQLANVFFGGTLIPDIVASGKNDHTKFSEGSDRYHRIDVVKDTLLESVTGMSAGEVNSAHHQSVDEPGKGLIVSAFSEDGIVEAMEWKEKEGNPFLMLVQWHPERMINGDAHSFSSTIRQAFISSVRKYNS